MCTSVSHTMVIAHTESLDGRVGQGLYCNINYNSWAGVTGEVFRLRHFSGLFTAHVLSGVNIMVSSKGNKYLDFSIELHSCIGNVNT